MLVNWWNFFSSKFLNSFPFLNLFLFLKAVFKIIGFSHSRLQLRKLVCMYLCYTFNAVSHL